MTDAKALRDAALAYHKRGFFVIPVSPDTKAPLIRWKSSAERLTPTGIRGFWPDSSVNEPPDIGLRLDAETLVIDLDPKNAPDVNKLYPQLRKATLTATTPSGGLHAWYKLPSATRPRTYTGMDVLTKGRMVVVPPSRGRVWKDKPIASLQDPDRLVGALLTEAGIPKTEGDHLARGLLGSLAPIAVSRRNQTLTSIAGILRGAGFRGDRLKACLLGLAQHVTENAENDPMPVDEIDHIAQSIDGRKPRGFDTQEFLRYEFNTADEPPELKWLVEGFLPAEGVTTLFGMGKQGKSYIAMELLRCLTVCEPFLGFKVPARPTRVLYVDWEKRGASLRRRLHALAAKDKINVTVIEPSGSLVQMVGALEAQVAMGGFELVIIDSLTIAIMQGNVNDASTVVPAMFALNALGCAVFVLDHTKKPSFTEPYETLTAFGSTFKGNVSSMNWRLMRTGGDDTSLQVVIQAVNNNFELSPDDIYATMLFEFKDGAVSDAKIERRNMESADNSLYHFLDLQTAPLVDKEIARIKNLEIGNCRIALDKLKESGLIRRLSGNRWEIVQHIEGEAEGDDSI